MGSHKRGHTRHRWSLLTVQASDWNTRRYGRRGHICFDQRQFALSGLEKYVNKCPKATKYQPSKGHGFTYI